MNVADIINGVQQAEHYTTWQKAHAEAYLTSIFAMFEDTPTEWSLSYFDPLSQKLTSFTEKGASGQEDPFSQEDMVPELKEPTGDTNVVLNTIKDVIKNDYADVARIKIHYCTANHGWREYLECYLHD